VDCCLRRWSCEAPIGRIIRRGGAQGADIVFVTGTIADAALGLSVLRAKPSGLDAELLNVIPTASWSDKPEGPVASLMIMSSLPLGGYRHDDGAAAFALRLNCGIPVHCCCQLMEFSI
jgi:hypothetical protein